ncbi:MAG: sugar phosphate isomerase/epimerase [Chloroflexota bacterium]|nr:sugar phosphate isomerase/epimerase [Chloroflexota bacterium]
MTLPFAYSTINWGTKTDLAAAFAEIRAAGWGAVELFDHALDWMGTFEHLRGLLGGLQVATSFGGLEVPVSAESITMHKRRIEYAGRMGATMYGLVGGTRLRYRPPTDDEYTNLARGCEELAVFGADWGVGVAYHPHTGCTIETGDEIDILLDRTQKMVLCLDASHIALVDEDPVAQLRKYRERLGYVHVKDWAQGKFVELGRGSIGIDFPACFAALDEMGFTGWVVVENSRSDVAPATSAQINADYVQSLGYSLALTEKVGS